MEFGEGEGKIPVDKIVQRAEKYKPKERVTYKRIKEYILEKYGFKVHTAYIAEVKRSLGLPMYDAPNAVEKLKNTHFVGCRYYTLSSSQFDTYALLLGFKTKAEMLKSLREQRKSHEFFMSVGFKL